jgi:hypothetical protein
MKSPEPRRRLAAVLLVLLVLLTRWPLRAGLLEEYDSANYALAVLDFDIFHEQPHPPGYIFYVWATRLAHTVTGDPVHALSAISAASGAVSVVLLLELLVPVLGLMPAVAACLATMASAQVWLQHVRPMQDAFAAAWMLACVLAVVRATERGGLPRWCLAMAMVGLSAGAKQVLPVFLGGLLLWAARAAWPRGGARWMAAGAAAAAFASLAWLVPLSIHCGSLVTYLEWALGQVAWQRQNDAAAFALSPARLGAQLHATFVVAAGPGWLTLPLWALAGIGAVDVARRPHARWILWLVVPLLAIRLLLLGQWPRFCVYYLPFVIALATAGAQVVLTRLVRSAAGRVALADALVIVWCALQVGHIWPTLVALHRGPSPVASALADIAGRFPPHSTLLLTERTTVGRHVAYYARRFGFRHAIEDDLVPGLLRDAKHVVKLHGPRPATSSGAWTGPGERLGVWSLKVPRADELTPVRDFWEVSAFELRGAYVTLRRFRMDDAGRTFAAADSAVVVFHAPPGGFRLRFHFAAAAAARFVVAGTRTVAWDGRGAAYELPILPSESAEGRVRVDVVPECGATDCLELTQVEVAGR